MEWFRKTYSGNTSIFCVLFKNILFESEKLFYIRKHWTKACGVATPEVFVLLLHMKLENSLELLSSSKEIRCQGSDAAL